MNKLVLSDMHILFPFYVKLARGPIYLAKTH